jgi:hypothetical protein
LIRTKDGTRYRIRHIGCGNAFPEGEGTVDSVTHTIDSLLQILIQFCGSIVNGIIASELWIRLELTRYGVTPTLQTVLLLALAAFLIAGSVRLFAGLIRIGVILMVVLMGIHIVVAALHA